MYKNSHEMNTYEIPKCWSNCGQKTPQSTTLPADEAKIPRGPNCEQRIFFWNVCESGCVMYISHLFEINIVVEHNIRHSRNSWPNHFIGPFSGCPYQIGFISWQLTRTSTVFFWGRARQNKTHIFTLENALRKKLQDLLFMFFLLVVLLYRTLFLKYAPQVGLFPLETTIDVVLIAW